MTERRNPATKDDSLERRDHAVLVGIDRGDRDWPTEESIAELTRLTETAGADVLAVVTQRLDHPNPRTFLGKGKVEEIAEFVKDLSATLVIIDDELTPTQQANLENLIPETKIADRTALILDIFALHAVTREGKLQVQLAQMEYLLPRLRGMWRHLDRFAGGGVLTRGPGESQLETDRRLARKRIGELKHELKGVSAERALQRRARMRSGVFKVALVGYTNAGKSTLLNALTGSDVLQADMLFATLDSTTRRLILPEGRELTLTDTVGFIHKLPHGLVEAFKSTLDEVREADLLLHVTDAGSPQREAQMQAVREVLAEIDAQAPNIVVINKSDTLNSADRAILEKRNPSAVFVSAKSLTGLDALLARIADEAGRASVTMTVTVPYTRGDVVALAHERAHILSERHTDFGTQIVLRVPKELEPMFAEFHAAPDTV
ncbi:MAG: GTPase HflX [Coriobacteriia bacterium]|nr:GTPase HflX [Coriobacteriia bacterium]